MRISKYRFIKYFLILGIVYSIFTTYFFAKELSPYASTPPYFDLLITLFSTIIISLLAFLIYRYMPSNVRDKLKSDSLVLDKKQIIYSAVAVILGLTITTYLLFNITLPDAIRALDEYGPSHDSTMHAIETRDPSVCKTTVDDGYTDLCYMYVAEVTEDLSICDEIKDKYLFDTCYMRIAAITANATICELMPESISDKTSRGICYAGVVATKGDLSICDKIEDVQWRRICYINAAVFKDNLSICDKLEDQNVRGSCYMSVAVKRGDISICDGFVEVIFKDFCYAVLKEDYSFCNSISDSDARAECYGSVALETGDPSICGKIQGEPILHGEHMTKNKCYILLAVDKRDPLVCENIQSRTNRYVCYERATTEKVREELT